MTARHTTTGPAAGAATTPQRGSVELGAELEDFTVTVAGPERHDGEQPWVYCVQASGMVEAQQLVLAYFCREQETDDAFTVPGECFPGAPNEDVWYAWNDLRVLAPGTVVEYAGPMTHMHGWYRIGDLCDVFDCPNGVSNGCARFNHPLGLARRAIGARYRLTDLVFAEPVEVLSCIAYDELNPQHEPGPMPTPLKRAK